MIFLSVSFFSNLRLANGCLKNFLSSTNERVKIVVHLKEGCGFGEKDLVKSDRIVVNKESTRTSRANSLPAHVSNFLLVKEDLEKICIMSPADLFVRKGVEEYIDRFDVGVSNIKGRQLARKTDQYCLPSFLGLYREVFCTLSEGSFYSKSIFEKISQFFLYAGFMYQQEDTNFNLIPATVEHVTSTVFWNMENIEKLRIGQPFCFSTPGTRNSFIEKMRISKSQVQHILESSSISYFDKFTQSHTIRETSDIYSIRRFEYDENDPARSFVMNLTTGAKDGEN